MRTDDDRLGPEVRALLGCTTDAAQAVLDTQLRRWSATARAELEAWTAEVRSQLRVGRT